MMSASTAAAESTRGAGYRPEHRLLSGPSTGLGFGLTMAFQPVVDVRRETVFAYEALVRGTDGASAAEILGRVTNANRYAFDQACRVTAISLAARLGLASQGAKLSMNLQPAAVYHPAASLRRTLETARQHGFPLDAILFEVTETEPVVHVSHLREMARVYAAHGFALALDDFGSGCSGLNLLAELEGVAIVKLDGGLVQQVDRRPRAQAIVSATTELCHTLGIEVVAECVERLEEYHFLRRCGIGLMQGFLFARPAIERLPEIHWPERRARPEIERAPDAAPMAGKLQVLPV